MRAKTGTSCVMVLMVLLVGPFRSGKSLTRDGAAEVLEDGVDKRAMSRITLLHCLLKRLKRTSQNPCDILFL